MPRKWYSVKSIFGPTIQGEGTLTGQVTSFLRFAGCNVWDGRPETKASSACPYCDTDFFGGDKMTKQQIVAALGDVTPKNGMVTISGGEPMLQLDYDLLDTISRFWRVAIETNGTKPISHDMRHLLHITCSPKVPYSQMKVRYCDDLKVLYPHPNPEMSPESFHDVQAKSRWLQPINHGDSLDQSNVAKTIEKLYELNAREGGPLWSLSLQTHKVIGVD